MRTSIIVLLLIASTLFKARGQEAYRSDLIPKNLRSYANAVIRSNETTVEVKALDEVSYKVKQAITILNNNGEEYGYVTVYYNKSRQVKSLKACIYDAQGNLIKKTSNNDFQDVSAISSFSLFEDERVKYFKPQVPQLPYTVVYEYELKLKQTLHLPEWHPQPSGDIAVESSSFTFLTKPGFKIRIRELNLTTPKQEINEKEGKRTTWTVQNLAALKMEPYSPPADAYLPSVELAAVNFKYEGLTGQITNWQDYGQWVYQNLLKGRDILPAATVTKVKELIKDCPTTRDKVQKIYEYAQQKNRYISIQIGIGGLQPMRAEEVDQLAYGDCKALTNYTKALLQVAGIPAIYTEVHAGNFKRSYTPDFTSLQGNHVILCVPLPQQPDTIWLECTSKNAPVGFLGTFTDDRYVLLCTEKGGVITRTPRYEAQQNRQIRQGNFNLEANGTLSGKVETRFEGTQYDNREHLREKSPKEKLYEIRETYNIPNLDIIYYNLTQQKNNTPATIEKMELTAHQAGTVNGSLLLLKLNQLNHEISVPKEVRQRKNKVYINRGFMDEDVITYQLPPGYQLDYVPAAVDLQTFFGHYQAKVEVKNNILIYTRQLTLQQGEHNSEVYEQLVKFFQKVVDSDHEKIILKKQEILGYK
ncbi:hypothetical protein AHMF7605_08600 [Adhaeribacter arboris]|uniref:DUF3857 domain-containing protein n=1 Tax=Adhaeribacter arboris TaxID=2072846 RepID=A0A2T2YDK2_9BACT|nr:DUF3857 domain-containing protein [Adhaeribacter arboris]PSR53581.1 hypothetical protein AHMF7605_08600 [Adhaeribacter arboris]